MKLYPVVHINNPEIAKREAEYALEEGADGVYLIDHRNGRNDTSALFETFKHLKDANKESYVGVNILGASAMKVMMLLPIAIDDMKIPIAPDGVWVDDIRTDIDPDAAKEYKSKVANLKQIRLLGGVAFKYTNSYTEDPEEARLEAAELSRAVDVVTTSGAATGEEPSVNKLVAMKEEIGDQPLAVASGISINNIEKYAGCVDEVLVASSIETAKYSGIFNKYELTALIEKAHSLE